MTYHPPAVLPLRREELLTGPLAGAEVFTAPVVAPTLSVWIQVVQDAHGALHRPPVRAELAGSLNTGSAVDRCAWTAGFTHHGARVMATLLGARAAAPSAGSRAGGAGADVGAPVRGGGHGRRSGGHVVPVRGGAGQPGAGVAVAHRAAGRQGADGQDQPVISGAVAPVRP